jgi:hypothetical protein
MSISLKKIQRSTYVLTRIATPCVLLGTVGLGKPSVLRCSKRTEQEGDGRNNDVGPR